MSRINLELTYALSEELRKLPGTMSSNLRNALVDYLEKKRNFNVSKSPTIVHEEITEVELKGRDN